MNRQPLKHFPSAYYASGTIRSDLHAVSYLALMRILESGCYYYPHLPVEKTEA